MGDRLRYAAIRALDWIDLTILRHAAWRLGLCAWIGRHPWWNAGDRIEAKRKGGER